MSRQVKCDKCGRVVDSDTYMSRFSFWFDGKNYSYDLCWECIKDLYYVIKDWIEGLL